MATNDGPITDRLAAAGSPADTVAGCRVRFLCRDRPARRSLGWRALIPEWRPRRAALRRPARRRARGQHFAWLPPRLLRHRAFQRQRGRLCGWRPQPARPDRVLRRNTAVPLASLALAPE